MKVVQCETDEYIVMSRKTCQLFHEAKNIDHRNVLLMDDLVVQKEVAEQVRLSKNQFWIAASHDPRQPLYASGLFVVCAGQRCFK